MDIKQAIEHRRSINFFDSSKTVSEELINNVLKLASLSPSTMNLQPWHVLTVISKDKKELLRSVSFGQPKVTEASCVFVVLADKEFIEDNAEKIAANQVELGNYTREAAEQYLNMAKGGHGEKGTEFRRKKSLVSATLFAMNLMYAAEAYGLETHPMGGFKEDELVKAFNIHEKHEPVMLIACGYKNPQSVLIPRGFRILPSDFNDFI